MSKLNSYQCGRRAFLALISAACAASALGIPSPSDAQAPPETTKIRLVVAPVACAAPLYIAKDLLIAEGFSEVKYFQGIPETGPAIVARGLADFTLWDVGALFPLLDKGKNLVTLAGVHSGCQEIFANEKIQAISDLKGKRIAISSKNNGDHMFVSSILGYVGIDPRNDVTWVTDSFGAGSRKLFVDGKVDAFIAFEPEPHELREKKIGHSILNTLV